MKICLWYSAGVSVADLSYSKDSSIPYKDPRSKVCETGRHERPEKGRKHDAVIKSRDLHSHGMIAFVKSRMLYARAVLNAKGKIQLGLEHIRESGLCEVCSKWLIRTDALNRYPNHTNWNHNMYLLMYIFPRQFGLHNAFTSQVDKSQTIQPFMDYTLREREIRMTAAASQETRESNHTMKSLPKRLRGLPTQLVQKLQRLHNKCSYIQLLNYYCPGSKVSTLGKGAAQTTEDRSLPLESSKSIEEISSRDDDAALDESNSSNLLLEVPNRAEDQSTSMLDQATPMANVSAFCRAVILQIIPNEFWGTTEECSYNRKIILRKMDQFINLRRFENMTLHEVMDGLRVSATQEIGKTKVDLDQITCIPWIAPSKLFGTPSTSRTDVEKRREMLAEFVYYLFDSILIPLIRSNFHVTESGSHRNRLFYFRHDVWRSLTNHHLQNLRTSMFEELKLETASKNLEGRTLGYSQIRLRPKAVGVRPIMNLRRRSSLNRNGKKVLGMSINSTLSNVHKILRHEKVDIEEAPY
jgi:telomerase reverse transcriptase